jgi:3-deoxy-7-phosphoheptulonate synthase
MIDCSHANSGKDHARPPGVVEDVASQVAGGGESIFGVMLESFLVDGNQDHNSGQPLTYGQSITDKCMSWERTLPVFDVLADAVRKRRSLGA